MAKNEPMAHGKIIMVNILIHLIYYESKILINLYKTLVVYTKM